MSGTPNFYAKVRAEVLGLLGWKSDDSLSPDAVMKVDLCVSLRLAVDDMNGRLARGESVDVSKLLSCADALARYLPAPPVHRESGPDPRETMWRTYAAMRERGELAEKLAEPGLRRRISELEAELAVLKGETTSDQSPLEPEQSAPPAPNVLTLSRPTNERTCSPREPVSQPPAASAALPPGSRRLDDGRVVPVPPQAKSGAETRAQMDAVNAQPLPRVDTRPANEPWRQHYGDMAGGGKWWGPV
jgi:hypothetical protein